MESWTVRTDGSCANSFLLLVISILHILWSRVESQAVDYTPWIVLGAEGASLRDVRRKDLYRTLLLDYPDMWFHRRIFLAIANRHFLVVLSGVISLLLKVLILLSTGLFRVHIASKGVAMLAARPGSMHATAVFFALCLVLTLWMVWIAPPNNGIVPRDPTTLGGTAALLANSHGLLDRLAGSGNKVAAMSVNRISGAWRGSVLQQAGRVPELVYQLNGLDSKHARILRDSQSLEEPNGSYHPWTIRATASVITIVVSALLVAGLWIIHEVRGPENRFAIDENSYFLWTSLVTFFFVALSSYLGHLDWDARRLAPFIKLITQEESSYRESVGLAYTDEFGLWTLLKSMRYGDWMCFVAKWAAILGWLLPIFSAALFSASKYDQDTSIQLQQTTYFEYSGVVTPPQSNLSLVQDILIDPVPTYPQWTYDNLALPSIEMKSNEEHWETSAMSFSSTLKGVKATLECQTSAFSDGNGLDLKCEFGSKSVSYCQGGDQYAGFVASSCTTFKPAADMSFFWGSCSESGTINVLMCNETLVELDVLVPFTGKDLAIDPKGNPQPDEDTTAPVDGKLTMDDVYSLLNDTVPGAEATAGLDNFFTTLVRSRLNIPVDRLGSKERINSVMEGIQEQHSIIRAQVLTSPSIRTPYSSASPDVTTPAPFSASLTYATLHLAQTDPQTYALTVILCLIIILSVVALLIRPRTAILSKSPSNIAARGSFVADSTLWWHLPRGAEWLSDERLSHRLRKKTFRLGMTDGTGIRRSAKNYTLAIVQDSGRVIRDELRAGTYSPDFLESYEEEEENVEHEKEWRTPRMELEGDFIFEDDETPEILDEDDRGGGYKKEDSDDTRVNVP